MRFCLTVLAGVVLASCTMMQERLQGRGSGAEVPVARQAEFIALVENTGCRVDPASHPEIHAAGFTDDELVAMGAELEGENRADIAASGELVLLTENCL